MTKTNDELTFEQQQEITVILEAYRANPSNSNKYRFELFEYVNKLMESSLLQDRKRLIERLETGGVGKDLKISDSNTNLEKTLAHGYNKAKKEIRQRIDIIKREELEGGGE